MTKRRRRSGGNAVKPDTLTAFPRERLGHTVVASADLGHRAASETCEHGGPYRPAVFSDVPPPVEPWVEELPAAALRDTGCPPETAEHLSDQAARRAPRRQHGMAAHAGEPRSGLPGRRR